MDKKSKGELGEDAVCSSLIKKGHTILTRNYRKPCGEIDIISSVGGYIVFTEVKARRLNSMVSGAEAVDRRKQARIIKTADIYLTENETGLQPRYDIAEVVLSAGENPAVLRIDFYEDAFGTDGVYTVN